MDQVVKLRLPFLWVIVVLAMLVLCPDALAQCAMCRASLAGSNNALLIRNFNIGVLVMLVPPVAMFCSIFVVLRRYKLREEDPDQDGQEEEQR